MNYITGLPKIKASCCFNLFIVYFFKDKNDFRIEFRMSLYLKLFFCKRQNNQKSWAPFKQIKKDTCIDTCKERLLENISCSQHTLTDQYDM